MTPQELAQKLHSVPGRGCVVVTGAGIRAISDLFAQPGTSRTILEAQVPYARKALDEFVGVRADQHVSAEEALLIAEAALKRARHLEDEAEENQLLFGVGCTAAVATDRVRRGEDRAHVAWTDGTRSGGASIWFDKNARTRADEDLIVSAIVLNSIAEAIGVEERLEIDVFDTERFDELD
ncbi:MAG: hypothetical protein O7H40_03405 [Gammaproteobacteria bacterium]|nr:hypothetical protein [Gammaproteobacteria bacterium]